MATLRGDRFDGEAWETLRDLAVLRRGCEWSVMVMGCYATAIAMGAAKREELGEGEREEAVRSAVKALHAYVKDLAATRPSALILVYSR